MTRELLIDDTEREGLDSAALKFGVPWTVIMSIFNGDRFENAMYALREAYTALVLLRDKVGVEWKPDTWNEFEGIPGHALMALEDALDAIPFNIETPEVSNTADDIIGDVLKWTDDHGNMPAPLRSRMIKYTKRRR